MKSHRFNDILVNERDYYLQSKNRILRDCMVNII